MATVTDTLCGNTVDRSNEMNAAGVLEISSNQGILSLALRTLRLSKSILSSADSIPTDELTGGRRIINLNEVAQHDTIDDCWIILFDRVYDVTNFLDSVSVINRKIENRRKCMKIDLRFLLCQFQHPGGSDIILEYAGRDASQAFRGHSKLALMSLKQYEIGALPLKECIYRCEGLLRYDDLPE